MGNSLHGHSGSLAALHSPHPALVQEVARQRGKGGGSCPVCCHAQGHSAAGGLQKVLHVENEGCPEVQRQLLIPGNQFTLTTCNSFDNAPLAVGLVTCRSDELLSISPNLISSFSRGLLSTTTQGLSDRAGLGAGREGGLVGDA